MERRSLNQIIKVIKQRRSELGYSQSYLAGKLDMSQNGYSNIESGQTALTVDRLISICSALNLSLAHLLAGQERRSADMTKLFYQSTEPMWIFDPASLRFLDVNEAATHHYGFTRADFMTMTICDIRPKEDAPLLRAKVRELHGDTTYEQPIRHWNRNRTIRNVRVSCYHIEDQGQISYLVRPQLLGANISTAAYQKSDLLAELRVLSTQLESELSAAHQQAVMERMRIVLDAMQRMV